MLQLIDLIHIRRRQICFGHFTKKKMKRNKRNSEGRRIEIGSEYVTKSEVKREKICLAKILNRLENKLFGYKVIKDCGEDL